LATLNICRAVWYWDLWRALF